MSELINRIEKAEDSFRQFDDWEDKYRYLISLGKDLKEMPEEHKTEKNIIKGCTSKVWLSAQIQDDKILFFADSDAAITKGIIALLINIFDGSKPMEILSNDFSFIDTIGLRKHLTLNRANGLASMLKQIKLYAMAFQTQISN